MTFTATLQFFSFFFFNFPNVQQHTIRFNIYHSISLVAIGFVFYIFHSKIKVSILLFAISFALPHGRAESFHRKIVGMKAMKMRKHWNTGSECCAFSWTDCRWKWFVSVVTCVSFPSNVCIFFRENTQQVVF